MKRLTTTALLSLVTLSGLVPGLYAPPAATAAQAAPTAFADAAFQRVWERTDSLVQNGQAVRSWFWGPTPLTAMSERYDNAPDGSGQHLVQYFDKSRMEINNPSADPNSAFYVTNGLLTVELISGRVQVGDTAWEDRQAAEIAIAGDVDDANAPTYASFAAVSNAAGDKPDPDKTGQKITAVLRRDGNVVDDPSKATYPRAENAHYEPATKHNIPRAFWDFLNASGQVRVGGQLRNEQLINPWFYASGYPISDAYWANVKIEGKPTDVLIQAYERRVLTYVPTFAPEWQVQMGNIGAHYRDWRYKTRGPIRPTLAGPHPGYGFNVHLFDIDPARALQMTKDAGFGWVRQQVVWADYQQSPARINWSRLDPIVEAVNRQGLKLMVSVVRAPAWAAQKYKGGMPDDAYTAGGFLSQMVTRYKGRIHAYEIWNEQNMQWETGGPVTVGQYVELLQVGYGAVKWHDPDAIVLFGGLTPTGVRDPNLAIDDVEYLKQFYAFGGGVGKNYFDVLGSHPGSNANSPDQKWPENPGSGACPAPYTGNNCWKDHNSFYFRRIEEQRAVMEAAGDGTKQMWLTEFGWTTANEARGYEYGKLIDEATQARYLVRAFEKGRNDYSWMGVMFVWNLNFSTLPWLTQADEKYPWSVLNRDYSPRPAYTALKTMQK